MEFAIRGVAPDAKVTLEIVDQEHGNVLPHYAAMGSPVDPTEKQVDELNRETALGAPEERRFKDGVIQLELGPDALVLLRIQP